MVIDIIFYKYYILQVKNNKPVRGRVLCYVQTAGKGGLNLI